MPGTASSRMGMPWPSCRLAPAAILMLGGCALHAPRHYLAAGGSQRLSPSELREGVALMMYVECPRLERDGRAPAGSTVMTLEVGDMGQVARATLARGSGDSRIDDLIGSLAAELRLDDGDGISGERKVELRQLRVEYLCVSSSALAAVELAK